MPEAIGSTENKISAGTSDVEMLDVNDAIELKDGGLISISNAQPGGLMESLAIGTGFDIAMIQQDLLPREAGIDPLASPADPDASLPDEAAGSADIIDLAMNDSYVAFTAIPNDIDPAAFDHHQY